MNTVIVYGPRLCGKTHNSPRLKKFFKCEGVFDDWTPDMPIVEGALHLTHYLPIMHKPEVTVIKFFDAMTLICAKGGI